MAAMVKLSPDERERALFVGQALDDPHAPDGPAQDALRYAAGVAGVDVDLGLESMSTRAGLYARFRYSGKLASIGLAYHHIYGAYRERARENGYALGEEPALCMFDSHPGDTDAQAMIAVPITTC